MRPKIPPKELRELWDRIPNMKDCKDKCANSCGPIGCSSGERDLIEERSGKKLTATADMCTMLKNGRCTVYSIRPVICRLWGVVPSMPCPHGCVPEFELSDKEGYGILAATMEMYGDSDAESMAQIVEAATPEFWEKLKDHATGAKDLGGTLVASRQPAAKALFDAADEMRARLVD